MRMGLYYSSNMDFHSRLWICIFCLQRNPFPPQYHDMTQGQLPPEALPEYFTAEYILNKSPSTPPIFLYVVDTCLDEDDLKALRESLIVSLNLLPPDALVGLITFGTMVFCSIVDSLYRKSLPVICVE